MSVVLNLVYALVLLVASPGLLLAALRHGKYRQGWRSQVLGGSSARDGDQALSSGSTRSVWARSICWRPCWKSSPAVGRTSSAIITTTTQTGYEAACRRYPGITRSAIVHSISAGPSAAPCETNSPGPAGAGGVGIVAQLDPSRASRGRTGRDRQRATQSAQLSRLPADSLVRSTRPAAGRADCRPVTGLPRPVPAAGRRPDLAACHGFAEVRRGRHRPPTTLRFSG